MNLPENAIKVLDKGYVSLIDHMGSDISPVNAARVSFDKESELDEDGSLKDRDQRLINYLVRNQEYSVFRHATLSFEAYMPLMVCRQYWKYIVGASHVDDGTCMNESSRRYITEEPAFYIPDVDQWRSAPENKKQGSGTPVDPRIGQVATEELMRYADEGVALYERWMQMGVCAEQARLFLPAYGMYVRIRTTMSLAALSHFLRERLAHNAQKEIYEYALAFYQLAYDKFPHSLNSLVGPKEDIIPG